MYNRYNVSFSFICSNKVFILVLVDGSSPGPIGHPNAPSPMSATPPLPEQQLKGDDTKKLRPIGGERAQRRAPGAPLGGVGGGNLADYGPAIWSLASGKLVL